MQLIIDSSAVDRRTAEDDVPPTDRHRTVDHPLTVHFPTAAVVVHPQSNNYEIEVSRLEH